MKSNPTWNDFKNLNGELFENDKIGEDNENNSNLNKT
jgi:hypothetical protein